jgi:hypothetical protein
MMTEKEKEFKPVVVKQPKRYDLVDLFVIGFYNLLIFSLGIMSGWLIWSGPLKDV